MFGVRHPGYEFIEQHREGLPTCRRSLARFVRAYTDFLRHAAGQHGVPIDVDAVYRSFDLRIVETGELGAMGIEGANVDALGLVLVSTDDPVTRRRFTLAHELVEKLVAALREHRLPSRLDAYIGDTPKKERLCHWGAAALLLPLRAFREDTADGDISLASASAIASRYHVSLLVALHALVTRDGVGRTALVVWRLAHKPSDLASAPAANQMALFESGYRAMPPKAVRVWWAVFPPHLRHIEQSVCHASTPAGSLLHTTYEDGQPRAAEERVAVGQLDAVCGVDARTVQLGEERAVVSVLRLPEAFARSTQPETLLPTQ